MTAHIVRVSLLVSLAACSAPSWPEKPSWLRLPAWRQEPATPPAPQPALSREQAQAALTEARALIARGDYPAARGSVSAVVPAAERSAWLDIDSDANFLVGETLDRERASREAVDAYLRAYEASRRLGDEPRGVRTLNALTNALLDAGAHERAGDTAAQAYALAVRTGDLGGQATAQNNVAEAHRLAGRLNAAREGYERALGLARQAGNQTAVASILINLGSTERRAGHLEEARAWFFEAQSVTRNLNDARTGQYVEWNLKQIDSEIQTRGGRP